MLVASPVPQTQYIACERGAVRRLSDGELLIHKRAKAYAKTSSCADEKYTTAPLNRAARDSLSKGKQDQCSNTVAPLSQI
jgi:hypothetical protein